jgi:hypothetical protein
MQRKREVRVYRCYRCQSFIFFDGKIRSENGVPVPQDYPSGGNHDCPLSPYNKHKVCHDGGDEHE